MTEQGEFNSKINEIESFHQQYLDLRATAREDRLESDGKTYQYIRQ